MRARHAYLAAVLALVSTGCALFGGKRGADTLDLAFEGEVTFTERELRSVLDASLRDFRKTTYRKSAVDDMAYEIERYYNAEGFPFATVAYDFEEPQAEGGRARAVLRIEEGPRTELAGVTFEGNHAVSSRRLRQFFEPSTRKLWGNTPNYYVESQVDVAVNEIVREHLARGYMDVSVSDAEVTFDPERTHASLHVKISEGTRYQLAAARFEGERILPLSELEACAERFVGEPYADRIALEIEGRVEDLYAGRGFADVKVERTSRLASAGGQVTLVFQVEPGPLVTIAAIQVHGNDKTRDRFVLSRLRLERGDLYSRVKERESHSRLYQTGLFKSVRLSLEPIDGDEKRRVLKVDLEESDNLELFIEPGYGSYEEWRITGGVRQRNLFGRGLVLQGEGTLAALAQRGKLSLIDPWFLGSDVSADFSIFGNQREEPSFERRETGAGIDFKRRSGRFHETNLGYQYKRSTISNVGIVDPIAQDAAEDVNISSIAWTQTYDSRDDVIRTKRGLLTKGTLEYADHSIGSELDFVRARLTQSAFVVLDTATTMGFSLRTGVILPTQGTDTIPLQERFFNGGENTVRSFKENELGPKDAENNPIGGEAWSAASVELRRVVYGHLDAALFYDLGNVVLEHTDYFDFRGYREAIGLGLRYELPVGPLRLDWGVNPDPEGDEVRSVLHFSVGMAF